MVVEMVVKVVGGEHVNSLCEKACQKLNALVHLAPFMNVD